MVPKINGQFGGWQGMAKTFADSFDGKHLEESTAGTVMPCYQSCGCRMALGSFNKATQKCL